jgi:hypothetical protein
MFGLRLIASVLTNLEPLHLANGKAARFADDAFSCIGFG